MSKKKKIIFGTVGVLLAAVVLFCVGYLSDYYKADVQAVESYEVLNEVSKKVLEDGTIVYHLHVAPNDMGRVIGKQGRIAKAIRTIMRAGAVRHNEKVMVEID